MESVELHIEAISSNKTSDKTDSKSNNNTEYDKTSCALLINESQ
jgi:hypothetical protein